jgi:molybdopterin molybdotransferase
MSMAAQAMGFREALETVLGFARELQARELQARELQATGVRATGCERVELLESAGRVLAEEIAADRDQPPFDRATRDGFAVRAAEWAAGKRLRVAGQVRAGEAWSGAALASGEAVEIMTGAAVPEGADAVAMVEHAQQGGGEAWAAEGRTAGRTLRVGENIVTRGSEARQGDVLLRAGTVMGAAEVALAAACGRAEIGVYARPRVAIVATGDELVEIGETPGPQQIRNSNGYALAALVAAAGGEARRLEIAGDTREELRARIAEASECDLLLLSGGVSAGKYDLVEEVLAEFGAEFFFTGVKMQPGRPVVFGRVPKTEGDGSLTQVSEWMYFFGLPGNPVSTQVTFHCFAEPMLRAMCGVGVGSEAPRFVQATLGEDVRAKVGLTRLLPARIVYDFARPEVRLVSWQGSGDLAANARANCYAVLPDGQELRAGDVITVLLR